MEASATGLSSLILTLTEQPAQRAAALAALGRRTDLQIGELGGAWLPAVLDSADPYGAFRDLEAIPGVTLVEVVFVELPAAPNPRNDQAAAPSSSPRRIERELNALAPAPPPAPPLRLLASSS